MAEKSYYEASKNDYFDETPSVEKEGPGVPDHEHDARYYQKSEADKRFETPAGAQEKADAVEDWVKSFGLGDAAEDISNTNLNTDRNTGFYTGQNLTNGPTTGWYWVLVVKYSATYHVQIAISMDVNRIMYIRYNNNGTWTAWEPMAFQSWVKGFGLGSTAKTMTDANITVAESGFYLTNAQTVNGPYTGALGTIIHIARSTSSITQYFLGGGVAGELYTRYWTTNGWGAWTPIASQSWVKGYAMNAVSTQLDTDPNTETAPLFLTRHANGPVSGTYFHILNLTWSAVGGNRAQIAVQYFGANSMYIRNLYGTTWTAWEPMATQAWVKGFGLGGQAKSVNATDLNTIVGTGFYWADRSNAGTLNAPAIGTGEHAYIHIINVDHDVQNNWKKQIAYDFNNIKRWERTKSNGTWTAWAGDFLTPPTPVALEMGKSAVQSIPAGTLTKVTFDAIVGAGTAQWTTDTFKAPRAGRYLFSGTMGVSAMAADNYADLYLFKNGVGQGITSRMVTPVALPVYFPFSRVITLAANDTVDLQLLTQGATNVNTNARIQITEI